MDNRKENLFKLQVFQQTISTLYMYPLRIYNNDCCKKFQQEMLYKNDIRKLHNFLLPNQPFNPHDIIEALQKRVKDDPQSIDEESEIYKLLESHAEKLREIMWETHASNSLTFTREIKGNKRLWIFLMLYDLFTKEFIDKNFEEPFKTKCLIDMQSIYVKLNEKYTLSIGRIFVNKEEYKRVVENVLKNYDFDNMNIFELTTLSKKRRTFNLARLEKKSIQIKKSFQLFLESVAQLPTEIHKEELELVALFIYMIIEDDSMVESSIKTNNLILNYSNQKLEISNNNANKEYSEEFRNVLVRFENNRDYFRGEYASRLKSTLAKKYSGLKSSDSYSPIEDLLKHIINRLNADGASFVKYNLSDNQLELVAKSGDNAYKLGIERIVGQINRKEPHTLKKSRVLRIIDNYYNDDYKYDIDKLILQNLNPNRILQPVKEKPVLSNIAIPITLQHKLLGVLLIDSFRAENFSEDDLNLIFSISNALSVQIFDQIVENNLSSIMEHLPENAELDDKKIDKYFQDLTRDINNIFFSYGVTIWVYNEDEKQFILKSTTLPMSNTSPIIIESNSDELIIDLLNIVNNKDENYLCDYDVNSSMRIKSCNPSNFNPRINTLRIYPIIREKRIIGAFTVYNNSEADYRAIDKQSLFMVQKHLTVFFNTIEVIKAQRALIQSEALHEINARFNMVDDKTRQLKELVNINFKELDYYSRYRFTIKLEDINNLIANTRLSFKYIANKSSKIHYENHVDDEVINLYQPLHLNNNQSNNIRHIFNELSNAIPYPYNNKNIRINNMINENINLKIHNLILSDIFQNILLNAVKYSFQGTTIRLFSKERTNSIRISVKNDGLKIKDDEEIDIFKYGYRGFSTKNYTEEIEGEKINYQRTENENLGIGLYKCNQLVKKVLSGEIQLIREVSTVKDGDINTFEIIIPKLLLDKEKRDE